MNDEADAEPMTAKENIGTLRLLAVLNTLPDKQDDQADRMGGFIYDPDDEGPECGWLKEPDDTRYGCQLPGGHSGKCEPASPIPAEQPPTFEQLLTDPLEQFDTRSELLSAVLKYLQEYEAIDPATLMRSVEEYRNAPPATASTSHMTRPAGQPEER